MDEQISDQKVGRAKLPKPLTKDEVIVRLVIESKSLLNASLVLVKENDEQAKRIKELEEELDDCISKGYLASLIEKMAKQGKIPVPEYLLKRKLPVKVTCLPTSFNILQSGIYFDISFSTDGSSTSAAFSLLPAPLLRNDSNASEYYPDFHMGYEKQKPATPRKSRAKKKPDTPPVSP